MKNDVILTLNYTDSPESVNNWSGIYMLDDDKKNYKKNFVYFQS